ncbi:MAG TPA: hypothetical protein V6C95_03205 [Coleofasciculaceae cyanobacterium]
MPLAALARSDSPNILLEQVVAEIDRIEEPKQRTNLAACVEVLAGLRFDLLREDVMQESVIYQDILQRGLQQGRRSHKLQQLNPNDPITF